MSAPESPPLVTIALDTEIGGWRIDPDSGESYGHGTTVADAIVHHAAKMLVEQLKPEVAKVAIAAADEQIVAQVHDLVAAVLAEPFRITTAWGSSGPATTIRERIAEQVKEELKPATTHDSYGRHNKPVIVAVIETEVKAALTTELTDVIKAARDKVVGSVRDQAADMMAKAVKDGLR